MSTKIIEKTLEGLTRRARSYVRRLEKTDSSYPSWLDEEAYGWLNLTFTKLLKEGVGALRPSYTWGVLHGAHLAKAIGINHVSVIEFGVAGGNGLLSLERSAEKIGEIFAVDIEVYGFDTGIGLPKPADYRDLPNLYVERGYSMDVEKLKKRLTKAKLVLGLLENTIPSFIASDPAPVAFISFDLDYYSSTMQAFKLLEADQSLLLPRVHCYFDDIMGFTFSDYTGERLAISEFNASHAMRKISPLYGLRYFLPAAHARAIWPELFFMAHIFDHDLYNRNDGLGKSHFRGRMDLRK